jgi:hypothetical protein
MEGINSKGFGILPKMVMQDGRLSIFAKAIYGYFCSYAGAGKQAFPRVTKIVKDLDISRNAYYKHFNQLRDCGYIKAEQKRISGKLSHNIYTLMEMVEQSASPCTTSWDTTAWDTMKRDTNKSNSIENKHLSLKSNSPSCRTNPPAAGDVTDRITELTGEIKEQIGYNDFALAHPFDILLVDEIVSIIVDTILTVSETVRVDGEIKPRGLVAHRLMELDYQTVEHVLGQFKAQTGRIRKKRQYLLTVLYNAQHEFNAHYTNEVNADLGGFT